MSEWRVGVYQGHVMILDEAGEVVMTRDLTTDDMQQIVADHNAALTPPPSTGASEVVAALEFYADPELYTPDSPDGLCPAEDDRGERARAALSAASAERQAGEQPCTLSLEFRDAVTCSPYSPKMGICHNHTVIAGLRQHAVDANRFELENRRLRQTLTACQGVIHEGLHGGKPTDPAHQASCERPACRRVRAALAPTAPAESGGTVGDEAGR